MVDEYGPGCVYHMFYSFGGKSMNTVRHPARKRTARRGGTTRTAQHSTAQRARYSTAHTAQHTPHSTHRAACAGSAPCASWQVFGMLCAQAARRGAARHGAATGPSRASNVRFAPFRSTRRTSTCASASTARSSSPRRSKSALPARPPEEALPPGRHSSPHAERHRAPPRACAPRGQHRRSLSRWARASAAHSFVLQRAARTRRRVAASSVRGVAAFRPPLHRR
jgi:hypothetical protein